MLKKEHFFYLAILLLIAIYFILSLSTLTSFPFVHSDEAWLSGLSRNIALHQDFSVTEPFFDLFERQPHALKILFHSIQIIFFKLLGYNIFSFRLISFVFGILTLYLFFKLSLKILKNSLLAIAATLILAVNVQFVYASHLARQEILILFFMVWSFYFYNKNLDIHHYQHDIVTAGIIGISIGIHPNSFIISLPLAFLYVYHIATKKLKLRNLLLFGLILFVFALIFIALSKSLNPNFISDYAKYGKSMGVLQTLSAKLGELKYYYLKLFYQVSGTYYTPKIRFELILFGFILIASFLRLLLTPNRMERQQLTILLLAIAAVNTGIFLIGRYNPTSIIFQIPFFIILLVQLILTFKKGNQMLIIISILVIFSFNTIFNALPYLHRSYSNYLANISSSVSKDAIVLANLNTEYYFNNGNLYDFRNLDFLQDNNLDFNQYIKTHNIAFIIYPEEMDVIFRERPVWNGMYGNLYPYYEDMQTFLNQNCLLISEFTDKTYGMRIARYINKKDWKIRIFKVLSK